jgi:MFS superfamily sulfate permease-like transporter
MFWSGCLSLVLGVLGLGKVVEVVPKDVLSAFTISAAFNIMFTQLGSLFQISVAGSHAPILILRNALLALPSAQVFTTGVSAAALALLFAFKSLPLHKWLRLPKSVPKTLVGSLGPFLTMVLFTIVNGKFGFAATRGLQEVGVVPQGLPSFLVPIAHPRLGAHLKDICLLTFVMLTETLAMGKALAARAGQRLDNSQEMVAMGAANVCGSFFQSFTSAGSFSRSAVVVSTGGQTQLAGIVTALAVVATLQFFTSYFIHVPKCVLAACLIVAVSGLVDRKRAVALWQESKWQFLMYLFYLGSMLSLGAAEGLLVSVIVYYGLRALRWGKAKLVS